MSQWTGIDDLYQAEPEPESVIADMEPETTVVPSEPPAAPGVLGPGMFDVSAIAPKGVGKTSHLFGRRFTKQDQRRFRINQIATRWATPKCVVVANVKGGAGKTPAAIGLAGAFGHWSGQTPILVDNDPTGNLRRRLEFCPATTATLEDFAQLAPEYGPGTEVWKIQRFLVNQPEGQFLALPARSRAAVEGPDGIKQPVAATITSAQFEAVYRCLVTVSGIIIIDSGNNNRDSQWLGALSHADALVVPVIWKKDYCDAAIEMLGDIEDAGYLSLARQAIILESVGSKNDVDDKIRKTYGSFMQKKWGLTVVRIPIDPHIGTNQAIRWTQLKNDTREAELVLASEVSTRFTAKETRDSRVPLL